MGPGSMGNVTEKESLSIQAEMTILGHGVKE